MGDGDGVNVVPGEFCLVQGLMNNRENGLKMRTGGNFRDDTAVGFENVNLGDDNVAENFLSIFDDRGGGFITGRLDGEDVHNVANYTI